MSTWSSAAPFTATSVASAARYAERWLALQQRVQRVPGVQAASWYDDGPVLSCAAGEADLQTHAPLSTEHLFRVASHSKTFTATAVFQLLEAGRLRLDDAASTWLPFLDGSSIAGVTVRQLLAHTSGIIRDGKDSDYWQLARPCPDAAELREISLDDAAVLPPAERFKYSNIAYSLLGSIIEAASGQPYNSYVTEQIVVRLGLRNTGPELDPSRLSEFATAYSALAYHDERRPIELVDTASMSPATGFYSTADDLVRYASAHFVGDERLLTDGAKRLMQHPESTIGAGEDEYALGLDSTDVGGRRLLGHGGGWPGHITRTFFDPVQRFAVSVLTNAIDGPAQQLARGVVAILDLAASYERDAREAAALGTASPTPSGIDPERFTGRFASLWGVMDVAHLGGQLVAFDLGAPSPDEEPTRLRIENATTLTVTETNGFGGFGEPLHYEFDGDGAVTRVRYGGQLAYPIADFTASMAARSEISLADGGALLP